MLHFKFSELADVVFCAIRMYIRVLTKLTAYEYLRRRCRQVSYLKFERIGQVSLYNKGDSIVGTWPAHNIAARSSKGNWPVGKYLWSHYNRHAEALKAANCKSTAYGCEGIHVFEVSQHGRSGMGIHAGRAANSGIFGNNIGGLTLGCVRTSERAMQQINSLHNVDPLQSIVISEGWFALPLDTSALV